MVIECKAEFRSRHGGSLEAVVAQTEEFRETQAYAGTHFIGMHIVIESELEIAVETDIEPFSATEQILVIDCELGGDSHQSCGIGGYLEICLEALQLGIRKGNIAIQHIIGHLLAVYVHSVEDLKGREPRIGIGNGRFIVDVSRLYEVHSFENGFFESEVFRIGNIDIAYMHLA